MATALTYTPEELNYFRICYVVTDIITDGLRIIFKQEWNKRHKTKFGEWKDERKNGYDFWDGEKDENRKRNAQMLETMKKGNTAQWDCSMLFYAILYSDCIGKWHNPCLELSIKSKVNELREVRNDVFAHVKGSKLCDKLFHEALRRAKTAFDELDLLTWKISEVQNQENFPTEGLNEVTMKFEKLKQKYEEKEKELQQKEEQRLALEEQLHSDVSPFFIPPPKPSHDIARRESEVGEVLQNLQTLKDANDGLSILYLSGNPGSGKSQLARLAARRFYDEVKQVPSAASFVMTLNAENSEELLKSYVRFAQQCKCPGYEITKTYVTKDLNTDQKISYFKTLISTKIEHYASWLLVVDNVTSESRTSDYLPDADSELWARGQMLITTQDTASIPLSSSSIRNISISEGMHPDDACFLLNLLSGISDAKMENRIAKKLDYQPLSLAAAATYVRQNRQNKGTSKFGWTDYLKKLEEGKRSNTESILAQTNPAYPKTMTKVITLAVEMVMENDIILHHMFLFLSMCASQPILQDIIIEYVKTTDDEFEDEDIRTRMSQCSLLLIEEESTGVYIRVHGVVLDVIKSATKGFAKDQSHKVVYGAVMSFAKFEELESIVVGTRIVPHLQTLSSKIKDMSLGRGIPEATERASCNFPDGLRSLNDMCQNHSEFRAALVYGKWLLKIQTKKLGPVNVDVASSYNNLGTLHSDLGNTDKAKDCYKRALEIQMKELGPEHVDVATSYNNLGTLHSSLGETAEAKDCYKRALEIQMKELGPEHVDVATSYNNLGNLHSDLGNTDKAKDCYKRALEIRLKKLGPDHVDVAASYNNLGTLHSSLGDTDEAKDCYKRALEIQMKELGPEHVDVATSCNNLGNLHSDLGDTDKAKDCYKRALKIRLKKLGAEHVDVATSYNNLGTLHKALGDTDEAKDCYERALEIQMKQLGAEHVNVATSYNNLGILHSDLGDTDKAKDCYKRALKIRLKKLGAEHVDVATSYNNLGTLHKALGDTDEAKDCYKRALKIRLKKLGAEHVDVATSYNNLGTSHRDLGETAEAKDCFKRALEIRLKKLGAEHVDVASSYNNLGTSHSDLDETAEAKDCYKRALEIRLKKLGAKHVDVARCYSNLAALHSDLGDTDEAKDFYKRALVIYISKYGQEDVRTLEVSRNLSRLKQKRKRVDDPEAVLKKKKRDSC